MGGTGYVWLCFVCVCVCVSVFRGGGGVMLAMCGFVLCWCVFYVWRRGVRLAMCDFDIIRW